MTLGAHEQVEYVDHAVAIQDQCFHDILESSFLEYWLVGYIFILRV